MAKGIAKLAKQMDGHRLCWWERRFWWKCRLAHL